MPKPFAVAFVALLAFGSYGAMADNGPSLLPVITIPDTMPIYPRLSMTAHLPKEYYAPGAPIMLLFDVVNTTQEGVYYDTSSIALSSFNFSVKDGTGRSVPLTHYGRWLLTYDKIIRHVDTMVLAPKEALAYQFNLSRMYDMSATGVYTVMAKEQFRYKGEERQVVSNTVTADVSERAYPQDGLLESQTSQHF